MAKKFIEYIHNYCDRWCERCPFTDRCLMFAEEQEIKKELGEEDLTALASGQSPDDDEEALFNRVKMNLDHALELLREFLNEAGMNGDENGENSEAEPNPDTEKRQQRALRLAMRYTSEMKRFFEQNEDYFTEKESEFEQKVSMGIPLDIEQLQLLQDALSTIRWYEHFIGAKLYRAMSSWDEQADAPEPNQSDGNGSAKIAMIAVQRSADAWRFMARIFPETKTHIQKLVDKLSTIRLEIEQRYPQWDQFHRPGFDDFPKQVIRLDYSQN
jgi:hypothetical protein